MAQPPPPHQGQVPAVPPGPERRPSRAPAIIGGIVGLIAGGVVLLGLAGALLLGLAIFMNSGDGFLFKDSVRFEDCTIETSGAVATVAVSNPLDDADLTNVVLEVSFGASPVPREFETVAVGEVRFDRIPVGRIASAEVQGDFVDSPPTVPRVEQRRCRWTEIDYDTDP